MMYMTMNAIAIVLISTKYITMGVVCASMAIPGQLMFISTHTQS